MHHFIDNECSRRKLDTPKFAMTGVVMGPGWAIAQVRRKLWLPFQHRGTHIQDEREPRTPSPGTKCLKILFGRTP